MPAQGLSHLHKQVVRDQKTHKYGLSMGSVFDGDCREGTACPYSCADDQAPPVHMKNGAPYDHTKLVALHLMVKITGMLGWSER